MKLKLFSIITICILGLALSSASSQDLSIPEWIKNNAGWWANDQIDDETFVKGIEFLVQKEVIFIPNLPESTNENVESIPEWIKNNAGWWANDQIDDETFVKGIEYLVKVGIIVIGQIDNSESVLFYSTMEEDDIKIVYTEKMVKVGDNEVVIIENELENKTGDKIKFVLTKLNEHVVMVDENGEKYLLINALVKNELGDVISVHLHVYESQSARQIIYIEYDDDGIFRKLIEPKHSWKEEGILSITKFKILLKDDLSEVYEKIGVYDKKNKPLVIIPTFTASAYSEPGFYTFYRGECDTELHGMLFRNDACLTVNILSKNNLGHSSSNNAVQVLELLDYESITDMELHTNPSILNDYDKIIVLHNEYVSKIMFDAITSHDNVIFLYPNALYAEVEVDMINNTITLLRGHNYPDLTIRNGFDWENDNTHPYEYDTECENWEFYPTGGNPDGYMLNCFPENKILEDQLLLKTLKDL